MALNLAEVTRRLSEARTNLSLEIADVARGTGIVQARLRSIESGSQAPSGDEVLILASFYDCDYRDILDEKRSSPSQQTNILFRRFGTSLSVDDRRSIQEFIYLCQVESELEELSGVQKTSFSSKAVGNYYKEHGQHAAQELRDTLGYKNIEAPRDIYGDFRKLGIHIFRRRLSNPEISGLYIEHPMAGHCVLVNYDDDIYRQRFSAAHEVAHAIFDSAEGATLTYSTSSQKYDSSDLKEIRANAFASCYLMPPSMLTKLGNTINANTAIKWANDFRVSTSALAKALKDAGVVDNNQAQAIRSVRVPQDQKIDPEAPQSLSFLQRQRRLGLLDRGLSDYYIGLCLEAFEARRISVGRLVEVLRIRPDELPEVAALYGRTIGHGA